MDHHTEPHLERCALLSIDMQNDFVLPTGSMSTPGSREMVRALGELVRVFREIGLPVVHTVRLYLQDGSDADLCRRARLESGEALVVPGTPGANIADGVLPDGVELDVSRLGVSGMQQVGEREVILYKPRWSAFFHTELDGLLREWGVDTVAVAGTWFPNCVRQTLYDASSLDYRTVAVADCIAGLRGGDVEGLEKVGCAVLGSTELFG